MNIAHIGSKRIALVSESQYSDPQSVEIVGVEVNHRQYRTRNGNIKSSLQIMYTVELHVEQIELRNSGEYPSRYHIPQEDLR